MSRSIAGIYDLWHYWPKDASYVMCMMAVCIIVHSWAVAIVSVVGLLERLCRLCLLCVLWCGAISGDIAATGACVVWSVGLHGNTMTVCRAFSMLVTVGLEADFVGADVRTIIVLASVVSPLFPPKRCVCVTQQRRGGRRKNIGAELMSEWRAYIAKYGRAPRENSKFSNGPGCRLARRMRKGKAAAIFSDTKLAEVTASAELPTAKRGPRAQHGSRRSIVLRPTGADLILALRGYIAKHKRAPVFTSDHTSGRYLVLQIVRAKALSQVTDAQLEELVGTVNHMGVKMPTWLRRLASQISGR